MRRMLIAALLLGWLVALSWTTAAGAASETPASAAALAAPCEVRAFAGDGGVNRAGLVVTFAEGRTRTFCVEFTEDSITGMELLQRSGLTVVTDAFGGVGSAVCQIDGEGCDDPGNCFCKCGGGQCAYWAYFQLRDGAWFYSPQGSGLRTVRDGGTDGWVWGPVGNGDGLPRGGAPSCAANPTETPLPSDTPTPRPTRTPAPTRTPVATATRPPDIVLTPAAVAPTATAVIEVAGATAAPPAPAATANARAGPSPPALASPAPPTGTATRSAPARTRTPASGVVRVSPEEGAANARASAPNGADGGSRWSLIAFAGVAVALAGSAAAMLMRRDRGAR